MSLEKFKFVTIGESNFRIGRLNPAVGSYILGQIMNANLKRLENLRSSGIIRPPDNALAESAPPDYEGLVRASAMGAFLGGLDLDTHMKIQQLCMAACAEMQSQNGNEPTPMPIATADGTLLPQISNDVVLVMRLEMEVLVFNLTDFFVQGGLMALNPTR
jgi:hypothetical protein